MYCACTQSFHCNIRVLKVKEQRYVSKLRHYGNSTDIITPYNYDILWNTEALMKDNIFMIHSLDSGWDWPDMCSETDVELYCLEELEVPQEHIDDVAFLNNAFQLTLKRERSYHRDDWYVNLMRCA